MSDSSLIEVYQGYIACLNAQKWSVLEHFVHAQVQYNGEPIGLSGYRQRLQQDFREIPDLQFHIQLLICEPPTIAARLAFDCTPIGNFLGLAVNGQRVTFCENVFYEFRDERIYRVWSVIDKAAIDAQIVSTVQE